MFNFFFRRLLLIPIALFLVNFVGFSFAHITFQLQKSQTIYGSGKEGITPVWPEYEIYARGVLRGDFGKMPVGIDEPIAANIINASLSSLGLVALALGLSIFFGLALGLVAVGVDPPRTMHWLTLVSTVGLAIPSFYIGTLLVSGLLFGVLRGDGDSFLPVAGFGWDKHLILPVLALLGLLDLLFADQAGLQQLFTQRQAGHAQNLGVRG